AARRQTSAARRHWTRKDTKGARMLRGWESPFGRAGGAARRRTSAGRPGRDGEERRGAPTLREVGRGPLSARGSEARGGSHAPPDRDGTRKSAGAPRRLERLGGAPFGRAVGAARRQTSAARRHWTRKGTKGARMLRGWESPFGLGRCRGRTG